MKKLKLVMPAANWLKGNPRAEPATLAHGQPLPAHITGTWSVWMKVAGTSHIHAMYLHDRTLNHFHFPNE